MQKIKEKKYYLIMCLICFLPRIIFAFQSLPFRTRADELGTLAGAAYLAGFDWSDLIGETAYYGFGATILFVPLFYIFSDPLLIYKIMVGIWGILQGAVGCMSWHLGEKYFEIKDRKVLMCLSVIASYMVVTRNTAIFNETPLILVTWLLCWCLLALNKYNANKKKKVMFSVLLSVLLVYSLTLHTRALIFWIAIIIIEVFYFIVTKRTLFSVKVAAVLAAAGYIAARAVISFMQNTVWIGESREALGNSQIGVSGTALLLEPDSWQAWANIVLGQFNTFSLVTGTVIIVAFVWVIKAFIDMFKEKFCVSEDKLPYLCMIGFSCICIAGTIFGQSISEWLGYVTEAMREGMYNDAYGLKAVTYIRYAGPYIGAAVWTVFIILLKRTEDISKIKFVSIAVAVLLQAYWIICILPYVYGNSVTNEAYLPFGLINNMEDPTRLRTYLAGSVVLFVLLIIFWLCVRYKRWKILVGVYILFLIYQYCYDGYYQDVLNMKASFREVDGTYEALSALESADVLPDTIEVLDVKNISHSTAYVYQFCFYDKKIVPLHEDELDGVDNESILVTNGIETAEMYLDGQEYYAILTDEEEGTYILTDNLQIKRTLQKAGYYEL